MKEQLFVLAVVLCGCGSVSLPDGVYDVTCTRVTHDPSPGQPSLVGAERLEVWDVIALSAVVTVSGVDGSAELDLVEEDGRLVWEHEWGGDRYECPWRWRVDVYPGVDGFSATGDWERSTTVWCDLFESATEACEGVMVSL